MATSITITVRRGTGDIVSIKPDTSSSIVSNEKGLSVATLNFELNAMFYFTIGDFATIYGKTYYITKPATVRKKSRYNYEYTLIMELRSSKLRNTQYMFYNEQNLLSDGDFSIYGTADDFINLLILNANRGGGEWTKGGVIRTGYKNLTFTNADCLSALSVIADAFDTEFFVDENDVIHLIGRRQETIYTFMYGRDLGLYSISREPEDQQIITRLYVFGSDKNLPLDYPSERLRLPGGYDNLAHNITWSVSSNPLPGYNDVTINAVRPTNPAVTGLTLSIRVVGATSIDDTDFIGSSLILLLHTSLMYEFRLTSSDSSGQVIAISPWFSLDPNEAQSTPIFAEGSALPFLENNIDIFGIIEGSVIIDDIMPEREATVTSVDVSNVFKFKDYSIDFDVNAYLIPGINGKVQFQTGQLAGYRFDIAGFNYAQKEFTILRNRDEAAMDMPSASFRPAIGDVYTLIDIIMPPAYVSAAEIRLQEKAMEHLQKVSVPAFKYSVECDPKYFRRRDIKIQAGDMVRIIDNEMQINKLMRVLSVTHSFSDEYAYQLDLGEKQKPGVIQALQSSATINSEQISGVSSQINANAMLNGTYIGNFKIEQGTLIIKDISAADTTGMKKLWIDSAGVIYREM